MLCSRGKSAGSGVRSGPDCERSPALITQPQPYLFLILVCTNERADGRDACGSRGSSAIKDALKAALEARGLKGRVRVSSTGCLGKCSMGPNVMVFPGGFWHSGVTPADVPGLVARYLDSMAGEPEGHDAAGETS